jgi:hypothetical protein
MTPPPPKPLTGSSRPRPRNRLHRGRGGPPCPGRHPVHPRRCCRPGVGPTPNHQRPAAAAHDTLDTVVAGPHHATQGSGSVTLPPARCWTPNPTDHPRHRDGRRQRRIRLARALFGIYPPDGEAYAPIREALTDRGDLHPGDGVLHLRLDPLSAPAARPSPGPMPTPEPAPVADPEAPAPEPAPVADAEAPELTLSTLGAWPRPAPPSVPARTVRHHRQAGRRSPGTRLPCPAQPRPG